MAPKNAVIYVDYENIFETLNRYGVDPLEINFFPKVLDRLKTVHQFNPIKCNVYCNFNKFKHQHQTILQRLGLTTCHSMNKGKNCSDLMLTVDALTTLYENPTIDAFLIISSDRDMAPTLTAIRCKGKLTYILTEKRVLNQSLISEADIHEYLEDIFHLTPELLIHPENRELLAKTGHEAITLDDMVQAKQVSVLLYNSILWKKSEAENDPVTLEGYISQLSKRVHRDISELKKDFEIAQGLGYVTIYMDERKGCLCLKKGEKYAEIMVKHEQRKECHG